MFGAGQRGSSPTVREGVRSCAFAPSFTVGLPPRFAFDTKHTHLLPRRLTLPRALWVRAVVQVAGGNGQV